MRVFVDPPSHLSQAMFRVARALKRYAPADVTVVSHPEKADVHILHVVGLDAVDYVQKRTDLKYAVVQYCVGAGLSDAWLPLWDRAQLVWSYYDLRYRRQPTFNFYHAPLGVDADVFKPTNGSRSSVMTSGYVSGPGAEAIYEVSEAADRCDMSVVHLGPIPEMNGKPMPLPMFWRSVHGVPDLVLAREYSQSKWVSGLRFVEGFELPVIEGLACGARPIVFDRADMRQWYDGHAVFVPEVHGNDLINRLVEVFNEEPKPVLPVEREAILTKFDWAYIAAGFWTRLLERM